MENKRMNGSEIARHLGITRQAVSQTMKSGLRKMYNYILSEGMADSPFDAVMTLIYILKINTASMDDMIDFYNHLPKDIRTVLKEDAIDIFGIH